MARVPHVSAFYNYIGDSNLLIQSESNVQQILISDAKDGVTSYGLTEEGKKQAKEVCVLLL